MSFPTDANYPEFPHFLNDIDQNSIHVWRRLDFGWEKERQQPGFDRSEGAPSFTINDKQFDGTRYDQTIVLGDSEEWLLTNSTSKIAHPFHIHINPFQVVEIFDPVTDTIYKPEKNFVWQDVISIPPAKVDANGGVVLNPDTGRAAVPGYVKIRHRFVDFSGSYVLHCHMLAHEDRGMMQLVRVIPGGGEGTIVPHH